MDDINNAYELRDDNIKEVAELTGYSRRALEALIRHSKARGYYPPKVPVNLEKWADSQNPCESYIGIGGAGMSVRCQKTKHYLGEHFATYTDDFSDKEVRMQW